LIGFIFPLLIIFYSGGGGGGYFFDSEMNKYNFGAGGGAGIQFVDLSNSEAPVLAVGGGGGCAACGDNNSDRMCKEAQHVYPDIKNVISCRFRKDLQSMNDKELGRFLDVFRNSLQSQCKEVTIYGGGGGGGGSDLCCLPFHVDYGFSFSMHFVNDPETPESSISYSFRSEHLALGVSTNPRKPPDVLVYQKGEDIRYKYDIMGKLIKESSEKCGGYNDWCCLCGEAQSVIRKCRQSKKHSLSKSSKETCEKVDENYDTVSWLLNQECCYKKDDKPESEKLSDHSPSHSTKGTQEQLKEYQIYDIPNHFQSLFASEGVDPDSSPFHFIIDIPNLSNSQSQSNISSFFSDFNIHSYREYIQDFTNSVFYSNLKSPEDYQFIDELGSSQVLSYPGSFDDFKTANQFLYGSSFSSSDSSSFSYFQFLFSVLFVCVILLFAKIFIRKGSSAGLSKVDEKTPLLSSEKRFLVSSDFSSV
jgi:hypothetical protein